MCAHLRNLQFYGYINCFIGQHPERRLHGAGLLLFAEPASRPSNGEGEGVVCRHLGVTVHALDSK